MSQLKYVKYVKYSTFIYVIAMDRDVENENERTV